LLVLELSRPEARALDAQLEIYIRTSASAVERNYHRLYYDHWPWSFRRISIENVKGHFIIDQNWWDLEFENALSDKVSAQSEIDVSRQHMKGDWLKWNIWNWSKYRISKVSRCPVNGSFTKFFYERRRRTNSIELTFTWKANPETRRRERSIHVPFRFYTSMYLYIKVVYIYIYVCMYKTFI